MTAPHDLVHKAFEPDDNIGSGIFAELEAQEKAKEKALADHGRSCRVHGLIFIQSRHRVDSGTDRG